MGRPKKRQRSDAADDNGNSNNDHIAQIFDQATNNGAADQPGEIFNNSFNVDNAFSGMDGGVLDSILTPGGSLQSWMLPTNMDWTVPSQDGYAGYQSTTSSFTPTHSTLETPPSLNLPQELQNIPQTIHSSNQEHPHNHVAPNTTPQQDPTTCACLPTLYLTLSNLTTMDATFPFPTSLHPLREAMQTASRIIACPICPTRFITGLQNVSLLNALLMCLAERFAQILKAISTEASLLEAHNTSAPASERKVKSFRLADLDTPQHLHTGSGSGGLGCAAAFSISLSPAEWRSMAKKVVRAEVHGPADGEGGRPHFLGLIAQMEERQDRWHRMPPVQEDQPRDKDGVPMSRRLGREGPEEGGGDGGGCQIGRAQVHGEGEHLCLKMLAGTRRMVDGFDWD